MNKEYYTELDGVRAIAALEIMYLHLMCGTESNNRLFLFFQHYAGITLIGVTLFFVLSGFLITRILLSTKNSQNFFSTFYIRRGLRIFPLYYALLVIFCFLIPILYHLPVTPFSTQKYYWVYLQNIAITFGKIVDGPGHTWSLAVEEHFYLIWPMVIYFLSTRRIKTVIVATVVIAFISRFYFDSIGQNAYFFTLSHFDALALGALLAVMELEGTLTVKKSKPFLYGAIVIALLSIALWVTPKLKDMHGIISIKYFLFGLSCFCILGWLITTPATRVKNFCVVV